MSAPPISEVAQPVAELSLNEEQVKQLLQDILGRDYVFDDFNQAWVAVDQNFPAELGKRYVYVRSDWTWGRVVIAPMEVH